MDSWSIPKRVKLYEDKKTEPLDRPRTYSQKKKRNPSLCWKLKGPHDYKEIDRWKWSDIVRNATSRTVHITEACSVCGKKRHRHEEE